MKKFFLAIVVCVFCITVKAQTLVDTTDGGTSIIIKDARIDLLEKKMVERNEELARLASNKIRIGNTEVTKTSSTGIVLTSGYRLIIISSSDRDMVMKVRGQLMQTFPDQKVYMTFQMPNTKLKFGNFLSRPQAEQARKRIMAMKLVTNNIYIVPDTVEMKIEKTNENDEKKETVKLKN